MIKTKGLGKGLSALLGDSNNDEKKNIVELSNVKTDKTPIHLLVPNQYQPRKNFDKKQLDELATSIKTRGIIQPIAVRKSKDGKFEIIAGERRWRAAQLAKVHEVPTVLLDADDELAAEFAVLENVQREGLNALEEAEGYQTLIDKFSYTQDKIADMIGKSRVYIANTLRLKRLPNEIQDMITNGLLTPGHARSLIDVNNNKIKVIKFFIVILLLADKAFHLYLQAFLHFCLPFHLYQLLSNELIRLLNRTQFLIYLA